MDSKGILWHTIFAQLQAALETLLIKSNLETTFRVQIGSNVTSFWQNYMWFWCKKKSFLVCLFITFLLGQM